MLAAQLTGLKRIEVHDVSPPLITHAHEVRVAVRAVGICGSDVHNYLEGGIGVRRLVYPFIPGHEAAGEVTDIGQGVTRVRPGDRVMIEPAMHCGVCDQCLAGRFHTCRRIQFLSSAGELQGCMCEQVVVPEHNCFIMPAGLTFEQAALAEPLSIGIYSVKHSVAMDSTTPVAILGAGPIGLCTLLAARRAGARHIYVTDRIESRLAVAARLGAHCTVNPDRADAVADILKHAPLGLAAVFECCGQQDALDQGINLLKPGGKLIITGIPEGNRISFSIDLMRRNELTVYNVRRQNQCVEEAMGMIAAGAADTDALLTHRVALADAKRAFDMVATYADGVVKAMVIN